MSGGRSPMPLLLAALAVFGVLASVLGGRTLQVIGFVVLLVTVVMAGARYLRPAADARTSLALRGRGGVLPSGPEDPADRPQPEYVERAAEPGEQAWARERAEYERKQRGEGEWRAP